MKSCQSFGPHTHQHTQTPIRRVCVCVGVFLVLVCLHCAPQIGQKYKNIKDCSEKKTRNEHETKRKRNQKPNQTKGKGKWQTSQIEREIDKKRQKKRGRWVGGKVEWENERREQIEGRSSKRNCNKCKIVNTFSRIQLHRYKCICICLCVCVCGRKDCPYGEGIWRTHSASQDNSSECKRESDDM